MSGFTRRPSSTRDQGHPLVGPGPQGRLSGTGVMDVSPFAHSPVLPGPNAALMGIAWLTLVAGALLAIGSAAFRRRDLAS